MKTGLPRANVERCSAGRLQRGDTGEYWHRVFQWWRPLVAIFLAAAVTSTALAADPQVSPAPSTNQSAAPAAPVPPPSAPAKRSAAELEKLAVPIALHPDLLISIILPAAVFPLEIVQAARFVKDTNNVSKVEEQPWDDSVKAVSKFPELVAKMDADLEWTVALGQAFLEQRKELMDTIQALRLKAQQAGTLKTTEQQNVIVTNSVSEKVVEERVVVVTNTVVQIVPSNPDVIYVPSYPPTVYYPPPVYAAGYPYYYGYGYYPYAPLMTFSAGFFWGAAFASHWNHCDWHGGDININNSRNIGNNNTINRGGDRNTVNPLGDRGGNRGDRAGIGDRGGRGQSWQPDQGRLQRSGAPSAKTRDARGWSNRASSGIRDSLAAGGSRPSQQPSLGGGGAGRPSQQPSVGTGQRSGNRAQTQPTRSGGAGQRSSSGASRPNYSSSSANRSPSQRSNSGAFSGVGSGGGSTRSYSNRGSYSRGGGGFSGGGGRGGGGGRR